MLSRTSPRLTFTYDGQNRVTSGHGQSFTWESRGVLDALNGQDFAPDPLHSHAVEKLDGVRRYAYDRNGSMTVRNLGLAGWEQTLKWDSHNRLAQVTGAGASESYLYDETGQRLRKTNLLPPLNSTDYLFPGYERTDSGVVTKHYSFNGVPVAVRTGGNEPTLLYQDGVGSTVYTTNVWGTVTSARGYYAFGATRFSEGTMPTDRHFTSQREDGTGLYYYNARYYDPLIGQFLSPDTIVPDPAQVIDYNRYLYARGNPLKFNDPSGHCSTLPNGGRDIESDAECWSYVDEIVRRWNDDPDYWNGLFKNQDNWLNHLANNSYFNKDWMFGQYETYMKSDSFRQTENRRQAERALLPKQKVTYGPERAVIDGIIDDGTACTRNWTDCGAVLDDAALGASTIAVTCGVTSLLPCAAVASNVSGGLSVASTVVTISGVVQQSATPGDLAVSMTTTVVGVAWGNRPGKTAAVGFATSFVQWLWDQREH